MSNIARAEKHINDLLNNNNHLTLINILLNLLEELKDQRDAMARMEKAIGEFIILEPRLKYEVTPDWSLKNEGGKQ